MDITRAIELMSAMWPDLECAVCKEKDGIFLDAAVMAAIMCAFKEELVPLEDSLAAAIIDVMDTFVRGVPGSNGTVFIPCAVHEVKCLKDFLLGDALHLLPTGAGECGCSMAFGSWGLSVPRPWVFRCRGCTLTHLFPQMQRTSLPVMQRTSLLARTTLVNCLKRQVRVGLEIACGPSPSYALSVLPAARNITSAQSSHASGGALPGGKDWGLVEQLSTGTGDLDRSPCQRT